MKRVKYVVANWKMNGDSSSIKLVKSLELFIKRKTKKIPKVVICPPYTLLDKLAGLSRSNSSTYFLR